MRPQLPPRVILDRNRTDAYLTMLIFGSAHLGQSLDYLLRPGPLTHREQG